ncbi:hypothetical protein Tco_0287421 [Tanacetum coccineum]
MFALEIHKSGPVCNFGFWEDGQWKWDVKFRRRLFDWEVDQFEAFSSLLNSMMLVTSNEDKVIWSIESSGKFSLKSFCYEVENMNYHGNPLLSSIWKFKAPPKARLICWQVLSGKFPIRDLLSNVHFVVLAMSIRLKGLPNDVRLMTELGVMESNVAEVLAIKEACKMLNKKVEFNSVKIIIESDYLNAVSRARTPITRPWRL